MQSQKHFPVVGCSRAQTFLHDGYVPLASSSHRLPDLCHQLLLFSLATLFPIGFVPRRKYESFIAKGHAKNSVPQWRLLLMLRRHNFDAALKSKNGGSGFLRAQKKPAAATGRQAAPSTAA